MSNVKFSQLDQLDVAVAADYIPIVDVSDSAMGVNGTNKRITIDDLTNSLIGEFTDVSLQVDETEVSGLYLNETISLDGTRTVKLDGELTGGGGGSTIVHPFQVTYDAVADNYEVIGGDCGGIEILSTTKNPSEDPEFLYVKIERNSSRVVIAAALEQAETIPTSTEEFQYIAIAYLDGPSVIQHRFEDIRLTEFMISDAGELKLVSVFDTTNTYDLP